MNFKSFPALLFVFNDDLSMSWLLNYTKQYDERYEERRDVIKNQQSDSIRDINLI